MIDDRKKETIEILSDKYNWTIGGMIGEYLWFNYFFQNLKSNKIKFPLKIFFLIKRQKDVKRKHKLNNRINLNWWHYWKNYKFL